MCWDAQLDGEVSQQLTRNAVEELLNIGAAASNERLSAPGQFSLKCHIKKNVGAAVVVGAAVSVVVGVAVGVAVGAVVGVAVGVAVGAVVGAVVRDPWDYPRVWPALGPRSSQ